MTLARHGRWVRAEKGDGRVRLINLDQVEYIYEGPDGASFRIINGNYIDTAEPFEDIALMVMVAETDFSQREPTPPLSRDQLAMFPERVS